MQLNLDMYQTVAVAAALYCVGKWMIKKISLLSRCCIPAPVVGGLLFAALTLVLHLTGVLRFQMDTTLQGVFMTLFFTSVGYTACFRLLKQGGLQVLIFLGVVAGLVMAQNLVGVGLAAAFHLNPLLGLCVGSIPMVGGHATSGSFGLLLDQMGVSGASSVAIASATFGLIAGSMIGGPIARRRIDKHKLEPSPEDVTTYRMREQDDPQVRHVETHHFMEAAIHLFLAMGIGSALTALLTAYTPLTFPSYIGSMLAACIIRNLCDLRARRIPEREIEVTGNVCLSLFLSMALMGLRLWELAELALPMLAMLAAQTILMATFAYFLAFRIMGRDYEAAVISSAFCGFGMGATPNAMANMQAVTNQFGPAPRAFFIVPLVGSLFIDFFNSGVVTLFISVLPH